MPSLNCPNCGREVQVPRTLIDNNISVSNPYSGHETFMPFEFNFKCCGEQIVRDFNS